MLLLMLQLDDGTGGCVGSRRKVFYTENDCDHVKSATYDDFYGLIDLCLLGLC